MDTRETIPPEIRACVEANALFDALRRGDFTAAAHAQDRLREMGWCVKREPPKRKPRQTGVGREGGR
jgi:hypothetical protein